MRWLVAVGLLASVAHADVIADRESEATRLETARDWTALVRASELRAALGQRAKWIATTQRAVRLHAKTRPDDAAKLMFGLAAAFEGDALAEHMRAYLRMFGDDGDRAILAHAILGEHAWRAACPIATIDGLCMRVARAHPASCDRKRERWVAMPRDPSLAAPALLELGEVVRRFETRASKDPAVVTAYVNAKLVLADRELEVAHAHSFPRLSFTNRHASQRSGHRLSEWIKVQTRVNKHYEAIRMKHPRALIASAQRIGQHYRMFASQLATSPPPHRLDQGEFGREQRAAYCDHMRDVIEPVDASAIEAFGTCAEKANQLDVHDALSASCLRALTALLPEEFPPLVERVPSVGWVEVALERKPEQ